MITSIRRFLLVNLLVAITATTSLTAIGNYYLDQLDIQYHLDTLLSRAAFASSIIIKHSLKIQNFKTIQEYLNRVPIKEQVLLAHSRDIALIHSYENAYAFQVWSTDGKELLHSSNSPMGSLFDKASGFRDKNMGKEKWRIFSLLDPETKLYFIVGEPYESRNKLSRLLAADDLSIMLLIYPLSGLLIWVIIGKGLSSIRKVANEVSHRKPHYLEPVDESTTPIEIKPLVHELNKLLSTLHFALDREKRFAADAAHELRTPLAGIKTQAQVAFKTVNEEEKAMMLNKIISSTDRCTHIVNQLLTLSRLSPEQNSLEDSIDFNLPSLVADIMAQLVPAALEKKIDIMLEAPDQTLTVHGNGTALSILIRNLIDNAIRYTPEGGKIIVSVFSRNDKVLFQVSDNGPGIPEELRARVFERFFRILGSKGQGSGLGLSIVQQIARLHSATVTLNTPPSGVGLEISVEFPRPI